MAATRTTARREREKAARRESIIDAAEQIFAEQGLAGTTMDEIAEKAELSKGLLYKYFHSKEDLYLAVCLRALRVLRQSFERVPRQAVTGYAKISRIGGIYVAFARKRPDYFEALVYQATQEPTQDRESYAAACEAETDRILALVSDAISDGIADGSIRPELEPRQTAMLLWGALHGLVVVATFRNIRERYEINPEHFLRNALDFLGSVLRTAPRGPDQPATVTNSH